MKEILAFDNVRLTYHTRQGEVTALNGLTFSLGEGEFAAMAIRLCGGGPLRL